METVNLANVYAQLLRKYGEQYTITYNSPPSYLSHIVGAQETCNKIVLVYKEQRTKPTKQRSLSPAKLIANKTNGENLNLTGSPLKDDCIVDAIADISLDLNSMHTNPWKLDEEWHRGIGVDKVRNIICTQDFQVHKGVAQSGSVWFLCTGEDYERVLLIQYEFVPQQFSRGIVHYTGVVPTHAVNTQTLVQRHYEIISTHAPLETYIENTYNIKTNVALQCAWSVLAPLPMLIDLTTCDVTLKQTFRFGDCGPLTQDFLNQLRILLYIRDDILAYRKAEKKGSNTEVVYRCGRGIDMDELRENIFNLLTEVSGFTEINNADGTEIDIEDIVRHANERRLTDLTDKLWEILKCCSNYKDLKLAFNILFQYAARRNIVNTPTNKNRLAEIITELANHRLAIPCLTGTEPLELLLEIGLEKLYKDYEYIFAESKICSAHALKQINVENKCDDYPQLKMRKSLHNAMRSDIANTRKTLLHCNSKGDSQQLNDSIVDFRNSHFDEHESALTIAKLLHLHCTLEHLLLVHINLNQSNVYHTVCTELLKRPLRYVDAIDDSLVDVMNIQLSVHNVREHLEGKEPHERRITMRSKNKFRNVKSIFYFNMENICPPDLAECFLCDEREMVKDKTYHTWHYRKISTYKQA